MFTKLKVLAIGILLLSSVCEASRIAPPPGDPAFRCSKKELTAQECQEDRDYARETNCITEQELKEVIAYNGCPACDRRGNYKGWCLQGCFIRGTKILVWDTVEATEEWVAVEDVIYQSTRFKVASIRKDATLRDLNYEYLPIRLTTEGPELEPLVIITTNKRTIGVTNTHGVALANGHLVAAKDINVGDQLLTTDSSEQVLMIERPLTDDLVFNLSVESDDPKSHLILAEGGLVVGDQFLQSSTYLNSTLLR